MKNNKPHQIHVCPSTRRIKPAPALTIEGLWLQMAGFNIGDLVEVIPGEEALTIKIIEKWKSQKSKPA